MAGVLGVDDAATPRHLQRVVEQSWTHRGEQAALGRAHMAALRLTDHVGVLDGSHVVMEAVLLAKGDQVALAFRVEQQRQLTRREGVRHGTRLSHLLPERRCICVLWRAASPRPPPWWA